MPVYFFDTSALVKRYVEESGSDTVRDVFNTSDATIVLADITRAEFTSAVARRARDGSISTDEHRLLKTAFAIHLVRDYLLAPIEPRDISRACELVESYALRAYDAIQLAVALSVAEKLVGSADESLTFLSADRDLTAAARAERRLSVIHVSNP